MAYSVPIERTNPSGIVFVIDQSGSMGDSIPNSDPPKRKCDAVADAVNNWLRNLALKCARADGVRDYYYVGVIGYGASVDSALTGSLAGQELVSISSLAGAPARIEERSKKVDDGAGGLVEQKVKFPIWFEPKANGGTPMCKALELAHRWLEGWLQNHGSCFPPMVIHITDGESTDSANAEEATQLVGEAMQRLRSLCSTDGGVLLFNVHLSSNPQAKKISFPSKEAELPDDYARLLFAHASELTSEMIKVAGEHGLKLAEGARGFVLNSELTLLIQAIDIGTRAANLR